MKSNSGDYAARLGISSRQDWADYWNAAGDQAEAAGNTDHADYYHYYGDQNQRAADRD
jgi:hypothetical protein